jgi:hypothetical protein
MSKFYVNEHPVIKGYAKKDKEAEYFKVGTVFTINSIQGDFFELYPVKKEDGESALFLIGPLMLSAGFRETDQF